MDIKIPSGPPGGKAIDAVEDAGSAAESVAETTGVSPATPTDVDAISRIAEQVASGEITRDQAVEKILAEVIDADIIKAAPGEIAGELTEVLKALLETDPHLKSLLSTLGPTENE